MEDVYDMSDAPFLCSFSQDAVLTVALDVCNMSANTPFLCLFSQDAVLTVALDVCNMSANTPFLCSFSQDAVLTVALDVCNMSANTPFLCSFSQDAVLTVALDVCNMSANTPFLCSQRALSSLRDVALDVCDVSANTPFLCSFSKGTVITQRYGCLRHLLIHYSYVPFHTVLSALRLRDVALDVCDMSANIPFLCSFSKVTVITQRLDVTCQLMHHFCVHSQRVLSSLRDVALDVHDMSSDPSFLCSFVTGRCHHSVQREGGGCLGNVHHLGPPLVHPGDQLRPLGEAALP